MLYFNVTFVFIRFAKQLTNNIILLKYNYMVNKYNLLKKLSSDGKCEMRIANFVLFIFDLVLILIIKHFAQMKNYVRSRYSLLFHF